MGSLSELYSRNHKLEMPPKKGAKITQQGYRANLELRAIKKGSEDESAKVKRRPQPKQQKKRNAETLGLKRHEKAPHQGEEGAPTTRTTRGWD